MARPDSRRALRRHHRERVIRRRLPYVGEDWTERFPRGRLAKTVCFCSCPLCGNPPTLRHPRPARWWEDEEYVQRF